jgi:5-methylthioadenosine/S-adenosylhomocysteine deaminase
MKDRQIVRGRLVVTRWRAAGGPIVDGAVYIEDGRVQDVGAFGALAQRHSGSKIVGDGTHLIMPGFVNAHSHGRGITTLRQGIPDDPGEVRSVGLRLGLSVDPYWDALLTSARQLEGGITATMHLDSNYGYGPLDAYEERLRGVLRGYADSGIRFSVALPVRDPSIDDPYLDERFLAELPADVRSEVEGWRRTIPALDEYLGLYGRLTRDGAPLQIEPVGVDACSEEFLRAVRGEADRASTHIQLHLLETPYQKAHALTRFGKTSVERLVALGFLREDVSCAHCVWFTARDIEIFRDTGAAVAHNPSSNLRLRNGLAPVGVMAGAGIPIALGIDNLGINDDEDMLQEVRLAQLQQSPPGIGQATIPGSTALSWATENGAQVLGAGGLGRLEPGSPADLLMARLGRIERAVLEDGHDLAACVVQWLRQRDIDQVIVGGRLLVRSGRYVAGDRTEIEKRAAESTQQWTLTPGVTFIRRQIVERFSRQEVAGEPYYRFHSRD